MHHKKRSTPKSQNTCNSVCTAASRHSAIRCDGRYVCRDCRVPTMVPTAAYAQRCADCEFARGTIGYHSNSWASCYICAATLVRQLPDRLLRPCVGMHSIAIAKKTDCSVFNVRCSCRTERLTWCCEHICKTFNYYYTNPEHNNVQH